MRRRVGDLEELAGFAFGEWESLRFALAGVGQGRLLQTAPYRRET
jgi:hypothetical protein